LQKGAGDVDADERNAVSIQFLQRFDSTSAAAFTLAVLITCQA
jgi:hypothetical protein